MNPAENPRYVVLKHTTENDAHFDFMLETGAHLSTWRINIGPEELKTTPAKAEKIFDHKLKFLTYQGPVKNGTGNVTTVDKGTYSIISQASEELRIRIDAKILNGTYSLAKKSKNTWQITPQ